MKVLKVLLYVFLIVVGIILLVPAFLPNSVHMKETVTVNAPAEYSFNQVNNLKNWQAWSPWNKMDTTMVVTYGQQTQGVGASYSWTSENMGSGSLTILESAPNDSIVNELDFGDQGMAVGYWKFNEIGDSTQVTWGFKMEDMSWFERYFTLMMGGMRPTFVDGLNDIKAIAEENYQERISGWIISDISKETLPAVNYISIQDSALMENFEEKYAEWFGELMTALGNRQPAAPPFSITHVWKPEGYSHVEVGIPVSGRAPTPGRVKYKSMPETYAAVAEHYGNYEKLELTYEALMDYIHENNIEVTGPPIEIYMTDPMAQPDTSQWVTKIAFPIAEE